MDILGLEETTPPVHSPLGPSNAERWSNCPGSVAASAGLDSPGNKYSAEGVVAHTLAEELASNKTDSQKLMKRIGDTVMEAGFEVEITEEMVEAVIEYRDIIVEDFASIKAGGKQMPIVGKAEVRVAATSVDGAVYGTADFVLYQKGNALRIYDFKYGKKVVDAKENKQMGLYALAVMDTEAGAAYDDVELIIVQPRAGGVKRWTASKEWLEGFRETMKDAAIATRQPGAPVVAGKWCQYCPAAANCTAAFAAVQRQAAVDFGGVAPVPVKGAGLPSVEHLSVERLVTALDWEEFVNSYFEAVKVRIRAMLDAGETVPGYKLVDGKSNRKWIDEAAVIAEFSPTLGEEALYMKKIISPAQLEKIVGKKGKVDHLTFKPEGKVSIARDSDPRPAARGLAAHAFTPIEQKQKRAEAADPLMDALLGGGGVAVEEDPLGLGAPTPKTKKLWP